MYFLHIAICSQKLCTGLLWSGEKLKFIAASLKRVNEGHQLQDRFKGDENGRSAFLVNTSVTFCGAQNSLQPKPACSQPPFSLSSCFEWSKAPFSTRRAASLISEYVERFTLHFDVFSRSIETTKFNRRIAVANLRARANQLTKGVRPREVRKKVGGCRRDWWVAGRILRDRKCDGRKNARASGTSDGWPRECPLLARRRRPIIALAA